jgi:hypothetical protein
MNRPRLAPRPAPIAIATVAIAILALSSAGAASAGAASEIEKVWSFHGGEVAVQAAGGGKLEGIVVTPTTFDECSHKAGEHMWTNMMLQPDGSYWGFHQWLFEKSCAANPVPGPTAWRVLQKSDGARYLLVCFSEPGGPQPTIAPSGATADVTRACEESEPTAPLPVVASSGKSHDGGERISLAGAVSLPKTSTCVKRRTLRITLHDPRRDPLEEIVVRLRRRKLADVRGVQRLKRGIVLRGLPSGTYTLEITATTVLGQKLSGKRVYRGCAQPKSKRRTHRRRGPHRRG